MRKAALALLVSAASISPATADEVRPRPQTFQIAQSGITFLTGDSWRQDNQVMRLYGVQACLRGSSYTYRSGQKQDCGAVALAMLAAIVKDTRPTCTPIAQLSLQASAPPSTILVICTAHIGKNTLDLGAMLITQGFGFAALANSGEPVYMPYSIEESIAQQARAGLWAFDDMPHPNRSLLGAIKQ
ncbi:thermonuclease family protein [Ensifer sp. SL37]|uniref:thermonuclease family protein n=1 Tax=Ensifer sp. SL37 TaxID=2995137 RepID=UPI002274F39F|nr:thermonuclease family protein [Ensifer sp. SL37]MCY1740692.1 thermonuclease family protein [Ensifer sp. SL37]